MLRSVWDGVSSILPVRADTRVETGWPVQMLSVRLIYLPARTTLVISVESDRHISDRTNEGGLAAAADFLVCSTSRACIREMLVVLSWRT